MCIRDRYKISPTNLRRYNNFSGTSFRSQKILRIPVEAGVAIRPQRNSKEVILQLFKNYTSENTAMSNYYLDGNNWNLDSALEEWQSDTDFERSAVKSLSDVNETTRVAPLDAFHRQKIVTPSAVLSLIHISEPTRPY